jgi:hypothetical protein
VPEYQEIRSDSLWKMRGIFTYSVGELNRFRKIELRPLVNEHAVSSQNSTSLRLTIRRGSSSEGRETRLMIVDTS